MPSRTVTYSEITAQPKPTSAMKATAVAVREPGAARARRWIRQATTTATAIGSTVTTVSTLTGHVVCSWHW